MNQIETEKDQLNFYFNNLKNSIPSSVIMVNKDNIITTWNKKATKMLDLKTESAIGMDVLKLELMGRERLREGLKQCKKGKKTVAVKSISIKNRNGDRFLTNITQIPLIDSKGEFQGIVMVMDDATSIIGMQAELERKQEEIEDLNNRFQETYTRLKLANMEKNSASRITAKTELDTSVKETEHIDGQKELKDESIKTLEPNNLTIKLGEEESTVGKFIAEMEGKVEELDSEDEEVTWKEKLKICDEIDKSLDVEKDNLKTKKLKDEESE